MSKILIFLAILLAVYIVFFKMKSAATKRRKISSSALNAVLSSI